MQDPGSQSLLLQFVILLILTLFNAFFSASEMALVSLNRSKVEQTFLKIPIIFYQQFKLVLLLLAFCKGLVYLPH